MPGWWVEPQGGTCECAYVLVSETENVCVCVCVCVCLLQVARVLELWAHRGLLGYGPVVARGMPDHDTESLNRQQTKRRRVDIGVKRTVGISSSSSGSAA